LKVSLASEIGVILPNFGFTDEIHPANRDKAVPIPYPEID
jgi:hypothetical protein